MCIKPIVGLPVPATSPPPRARRPLDLLRSHAGDIRARFAVKRIGLFGSYARGEQKASSDIDMLVEFEKPTFRNFIDLSFYLEDLFGREVDLVTVGGLHSRIRPYVEKDVIWSE